MVSPVQIHVQNTQRGIYESFDFRGLTADGRHAFILKHTLFKPWFGTGTVTIALICFDRKTAKSQTLSECEDLTPAYEKQFKQAKSWESCSFAFASGSFFDISREMLRGKIHSHQGTVSWNLHLQRQDEVLHQLPQGLCFELPWPRHKVQVRDCFLKFHGKVQGAGVMLSGSFEGSNHHYWGDGYPVEYAAAQCNHFVEDESAFFYGFSARLSIAKLMTSPYISMASLKLHGRWYNFNDTLQSVRHQLEALDNYRWRITFFNADYGLDVDIDGGNPRINAWTGWHAEQSWGGRSVIKTTPFATGTMTLYQRNSKKLVAELTTRNFELKTLLPENESQSSGFSAEP